MRLSVKRIINILIIVQIAFNLYGRIIYSYFPSAAPVLFVPDVIAAIFAFLMYGPVIFNRNGKIEIKKGDYSSLFLIAFLAYTLLAFFWSDWNVYNASTRWRYIFCGIMTFFAIKKYMDNNTYTAVIRLMCLSQVINLLFVYYQCRNMGLHPDFCNGIFGFTDFSNAASGLFCLAISLLALIYYIDGSWSRVYCLLWIGISCVICALSEIKIFFVVFVICAILIVLLRKNGWKEVARIIFGAIMVGLLLYGAYKIIEQVFPHNLETFFSLERYLNYERRDTYAGRTNTISYVYEHLFQNNLWEALWGKGLGSHSLEYVYELGKAFADFGFIGLAILGGFIVSVFLEYFRKRDGKINKSELLMTAIFSVVFMIGIVVWNCTFNRSTYISFFFLAITNVKWLSKKEKSE